MVRNSAPEAVEYLHPAGCRVVRGRLRLRPELCTPLMPLRSGHPNPSDGLSALSPRREKVERHTSGSTIGSPCATALSLMSRLAPALLWLWLGANRRGRHGAGIRAAKRDGGAKRASRDHRSASRVAAPSSRLATSRSGVVPSRPGVEWDTAPRAADARISVQAAFQPPQRQRGATSPGAAGGFSRRRRQDMVTPDFARWACVPGCA